MSTVKCRACIVLCMDFRLNQHLARFLVDEHLDRDGADIIRVAGAGKSLANPTEIRDRTWLLEQLRISYELHQSRQFYLINHEDCGAYGNEDDLDIHRQDLRKAKECLERHFRDVEVLPLFMKLDGEVDRIC